MCHGKTLRDYNPFMATGIQTFLDLLADFGVKQIFGNPGTTELPLNDAMVTDRRIKYILGLQEVPVMAMADGYAMASGSLGVCAVVPQAHEKEGATPPRRSVATTTERTRFTRAPRRGRRLRRPDSGLR